MNELLGKVVLPALFRNGRQARPAVGAVLQSVRPTVPILGLIIPAGLESLVRIFQELPVLHLVKVRTPALGSRIIGRKAQRLGEHPHGPILVAGTRVADVVDAKVRVQVDARPSLLDHRPAPNDRARIGIVLQAHESRQRLFNARLDVQHHAVVAKLPVCLGRRLAKELLHECDGLIKAPRRLKELELLHALARISAHDSKVIGRVAAAFGFWILAQAPPQSVGFVEKPRRHRIAQQIELCPDVRGIEQHKTPQRVALKIGHAEILSPDDLIDEPFTLGNRHAHKLTGRALVDGRHAAQRLMRGKNLPAAGRQCGHGCKCCCQESALCHVPRLQPNGEASTRRSRQRKTPHRQIPEQT